MQKNQQWIMLFASQDDPYIPIQEARYIQQQLDVEYYEFTDQGHFQEKTIPLLLEPLLTKLGADGGNSGERAL